MQATVKKILNLFSLALVFPFFLLSFFESKFFPSSEIAYQFGAHCMAILPGLPGMYLRRAYYHLTAVECDLSTTIGFGTLLTHRNVVVKERTAIGNYSVLGAVKIGEGCEIGSRVSIPSGKQQHSLTEDGTWTPFDLNAAQVISIADNVWIGEGAIVMADVGGGSLIAAGAVVLRSVPSGVVVGGNPAKIVKTLSAI